MHTQEELNKAIIELYNDYKEAMKDYKNGNCDFFREIAKIKNNGDKYTKEEVQYIGFNALMLLYDDMKNDNI